MMRAIEWGLVATAVIRPAITLCMFGGADLAAHAALHVGTHSMVQVVVDLAAGTAVTVGGEGTMAGLAAPAKRLLADLFARYYEERAAILAHMVHDCVLGRHLERINRLAALAERDDYRTAVRIAGDLSRELTVLDESPPGLGDTPLPRFRNPGAMKCEKKSCPLADRFNARDWEREHLLAGFDRFHTRLVDWARTAPAWPPFAAAERLISRLEPRLRVPEIDLDRALVIGFLGGSGTGKSTLFNALLGRSISRAGKEYRPMTRRAIVACHPDVDPCFLGLDADALEVHRLNIPLLDQMILVDCPDPDTQDPDDGSGGQRHLDILRTVLPHCDVLVHTVTSQKYKSHVVGQELLKNTPGRQILYVQTHSAIDPDNRADLRTYLDTLGLRVPEVFRFDAVEALAHQEHGEPVDADFSRFRDLLEHELASRARHRIRRANLLGLYEWLLATIKTPITGRLEECHPAGTGDGTGPLGASGQDSRPHDRAHRHQPATLAIADSPPVDPKLGRRPAGGAAGPLVGRGQPGPIVDSAASSDADPGAACRRLGPQPACR